MVVCWILPVQVDPAKRLPCLVTVWSYDCTEKVISLTFMMITASQPASLYDHPASHSQQSPFTVFTLQPTFKYLGVVFLARGVGGTWKALQKYIVQAASKSPEVLLYQREGPNARLNLPQVEEGLLQSQTPWAIIGIITRQMYQNSTNRMHLLSENRNCPTCATSLWFLQRSAQELNIILAAMPPRNDRSLLCQCSSLRDQSCFH